MGRPLAAIVLAAAVIAGSWWVARLPGRLLVQAGAISIETATPVAVLGLVLLLVLAVALTRLLSLLSRLPRRGRRWRGGRRRQLGDEAVTGALLALAAGKPAEAQREAARARDLLGDTPQTLVLAAEAARLAGREDAAAQAFRALAARPDAAFLGWRGLLRQAIARADWAEASTLAGRAEAAAPGASWIRSERAQLAVRAGDWTGALALTAPTALRAALATAAAGAEADPVRARRLARQAFEADPALAPAAIAYAIRLRAAGRERRAQAVLRRAWTAGPHPDIAACALALTDDPLARVPQAARLVADAAGHPESHLLLAQSAAAAGLTGEARRHAEAARAAGLDQRRLWLLLADIEESERGDTEAGRRAQRDALRRAANAAADPEWRCAACGTPCDAWRPVCTGCGAVGRIAWRSSPGHGALPVHGDQPASLPRP